MEPVEIRVLNRLRDDIKMNVLVTANMLRRLEAQEMITRTDRDMLMKYNDSALRNPKLIDILKKKKGGFQSLMEVLMLEKITNRYYVDKMKHLADEHQEKKPIKTKEDANTINKMKEKLGICMKLYTGVIPLVLGHNQEKVVSRSMVEEVLKQLERCRYTLDENHSRDDLPLSDLQDSFLSMIQDQQRINGAAALELRIQIQELSEKCSHLEFRNKQQDTIISELVGKQSKATPGDDHSAPTDSLSPGRQHLESELFSPRGPPTINIGSVNNMSVQQ